MSQNNHLVSLSLRGFDPAVTRLALDELKHYQPKSISNDLISLQQQESLKCVQVFESQCELGYCRAMENKRRIQEVVLSETPEFRTGRCRYQYDRNFRGYLKGEFCSELAGINGYCNAIHKVTGPAKERKLWNAAREEESKKNQKEQKRQAKEHKKRMKRKRKEHKEDESRKRQCSPEPDLVADDNIIEEECNLDEEEKPIPPEEEKSYVAYDDIMEELDDEEEPIHTNTLRSSSLVVDDDIIGG
eukprot:138498_1